MSRMKRWVAGEKLAPLSVTRDLEAATNDLLARTAVALARPYGTCAQFPGCNHPLCLTVGAK